jgi:hypothetical protein
MLNDMASRQTRNNDSDVVAVTELTFGNVPITKPIANDIGLNSGSLKVIRSDSYQIYPATVKTNSNALKITGLIERLLNPKDLFVAATCCSMAPTFTSEDASWS